MKSLADITGQKTTALFDRLGVFFAFSKSQFEEKQVKCIIYVSMGSGMVCPKANADELHKEFQEIVKVGREQDMEENGRAGIIHRELANYGTQITGDIDDTVDALADYGITREEIQSEYQVFYQKCIDNDWF